MSNEYIDVDFTETTEDKTQTPDINISTDPISALITTIGTVGKSISEYNMCKQQEETKRSQIKAQLKLGIAQINAQKEECLKALSYKHEENMLNINNRHEYILSLIHNNEKIVQTGIEIALKNNDISALIEISNCQNAFIELISKMNLINNNQLSIEDRKINGYLE